MVSGHGAPDIQREASIHVVLADLVSKERRLDVEGAVFDVAVGAIVGVILELPVPTAAQRDLVLPQAEVERVELLVQDQLP